MTKAENKNGERWYQYIALQYASEEALRTLITELGISAGNSAGALLSAQQPAAVHIENDSFTVVLTVRGAFNPSFPLSQRVAHTLELMREAEEGVKEKRCEHKSRGCLATKDNVTREFCCACRLILVGGEPTDQYIELDHIKDSEKKVGKLGEDLSTLNEISSLVLSYGEEEHEFGGDDADRLIAQLTSLLREE